MTRTPRLHAGFTLIELLVVIAILSILIALLVPGISRFIGEAETVQCMSNMRQCGIAVETFASDHNGIIPATISTGLYQGPEPWQKGFLGGEVLPPGMAAPRHWYTVRGMLVPYIGSPDVFRCPSHEDGVLGSGVGRNRMHDASMISAFGGARLSLLPRRARVWTPKANGYVEVPCPLLVEEDPRYGLNLRYIDPDHTTINRLGTWHQGRTGCFLGTDLSGQRLRYGGSPGPESRAWISTTPSGDEVRLGNVFGYGTWNRL